MTTTVEAETALPVVQEKQIRCNNYNKYVHIFTYKDSNRQNRFKDETSTYCNKKGNTETVCFTKRDDDKLTKMALKVSPTMAE